MEAEKIKTVHIEKGIARFGVVSDTHIPTRARLLPPALFKILDGVDLILHAGDLVDEQVLDELAMLAPVEAVAGNMDPLHLRRRLGRRKLIKTGGCTIGLIHGDGSRAATAQYSLSVFENQNPDAIVFGHSHQPYNERVHGGILLFNPGSPTDPRWAKRPSCGILTITGGKISGKIVHLIGT
jgi:putative phosphoesterase